MNTCKDCAYFKDCKKREEQEPLQYDEFDGLCCQSPERHKVDRDDPACSVFKLFRP